MAELAVISSAKGVKVAILAAENSVIASTSNFDNFKVLFNVIFMGIVFMKGTRLIKPLLRLLLD